MASKLYNPGCPCCCGICPGDDRDIELVVDGIADGTCTNCDTAFNGTFLMSRYACGGTLCSGTSTGVIFVANYRVTLPGTPCFGFQWRYELSVYTSLCEPIGETEQVDLILYRGATPLLGWAGEHRVALCESYGADPVVFTPQTSFPNTNCTIPVEATATIQFV